MRAMDAHLIASPWFGLAMHLDMAVTVHCLRIFRRPYAFYSHRGTLLADRGQGAHGSKRSDAAPLKLLGYQSPQCQS